EPLAQEGYLMDLPVKPGEYHLVAWCHKRHENAAGFDLSGGDNPTHFTDHFKMKMQRAYEGDQAHSTTDLHALFHGKVSVNLPDTWGTHVVTVPLTKDTNSIRIQLVHLSGKEIKADDFDFKITDNNGHLAHDNAILDDEDIEYRPWSKREGVAGTVLPVVVGGRSSVTPIPGSGGSSTAAPTVHSITAELTTSRLQTSQQPMLTVIRKSDNTPVVNINLLDYFLMVKGEYNRPMDDDEYFDRQD
ncbi:MAG: FimB/Mfa2 family fimbrial subunit, partial [Duncaniella sp.]|nr:FimB/Mfa2 family fimbrial subunit [Duncaniella sp.]